MAVKATINSHTEGPSRLPHPAPPDAPTRPTYPNPNAEDEIATEAMRRHRIRANKRFKELADALNGRQVTVHTLHEPATRSPISYG